MKRNSGKQLTAGLVVLGIVVGCGGMSTPAKEVPTTVANATSGVDAKTGAAASQPAAGEPVEIDIGTIAPLMEYTMTGLDGEGISLSEIKGDSGLLVIFSCNTCPWVIAWEDRYNALHELAEKNGVGMVLVNSNEGKRDGEDSLEAMRAHAEKNTYTAPYVVDQNSELADAFGAARTPHIFLFDKKLKLVYRGAIDDNAKEPSNVKDTWLMDALRAVGTGEKIPVVSTKSLGCSIKRI